MHAISNSERFHVSDILYVNHLAAMSRWQVRFPFLLDATDDDTTWMRNESSQPIGFALSSFFLQLWQISQTKKNVRIFFMHNKSQCCCAVTSGTLLIICKSHVFHYKQATSGPMAMRLCADVHGNNWNIQPVLMILWGGIFVLWRTCFNFWWIPARVLVFFGDYPPVIGPLPFLVGPPGEQF